MTEREVTHAMTPFDRERQATLEALMDLLIPASRDGRMPSARSLSLYADVSTLPSQDRMLFDRGLADLDAESHHVHATAFASLAPAQAYALVETLRVRDPAFISSFMTQTVGRYLSHDVVMPLIGLEARPHWPKGHVVPEGDWSLIDVVRRRPKIYRAV